MTLYLTNRDGLGKTSEEGHYRFQTNVWSGQVLGANSLKVTQNSPLGMSVLIDVGDFKIDTTGYSYTGWNSVQTAITIATADLANPRITCVVVYVDKGASTSASPPNNPGIIKFKTVNGTPEAIPVAPNAATIQASVGAGNPYIVIANITVPTAATQIVTGNISDQRVRVTLGTDLVASGSILDGAVTNSKIGALAVDSGKLASNAVTTAKVADGAITTAEFRPSIIESNFNTTTRWAQTTTGVWQTVTNCSLNYTAGPTNETLFLWLTTMASKDTGSEGSIRLSIGGVGQIAEMYYNPSVPWGRYCQNYVVDVAANATVAIAVQSRNASGGTFNITNDQVKWMPKITGFSIYRP